MNNITSKIISGIYILLLILVIAFTSLFVNLHYFATILFFISLLLATITFFIYEKSQINNKIKFLIILTTLFSFGIFIETWHMFITYPTIAITNDYTKAQSIQKLISSQYNTFAEINDFNSKQLLSLHTYSHKTFDKIAITIADSDLYDPSVKIGVYYQPTNNIAKSQKRFEKAINERIKLINGVTTTETSIKYFLKDEKIDPKLTTIKINITTKPNADKNEIKKIIYNFLPTEKDKTFITIL